MNNERIYLSSPHMGTLEEQFIKQSFETNWIAPLGPNVNGFEDELAKYVNTNYAAATSSGTAAIHLALELIGVSKDDIVFCSSLTFIASANPILYQGAKPVFIDSEPNTWNMSPIALEKAFRTYHTKGIKPKAVIVVNLYGQSADYDEIIKVCEKYDTAIIEDAAESLGSTYKGKMSGTLGDYGVFSFNGNKIITTSGGGMLISDSEDSINKAKYLATQAKEPSIHYEHKRMGYNYRMSNVLAGIGRGQLKVLEDRVNARRLNYEKYEVALGHLSGFNFMPEQKFGRHNRWLTTLTVDPEAAGISRTEIIEALAVENIESRPVWKPLHLQELFVNNDYFPHEEGKSVSDHLFEEGLCLPSGSNMSDIQQKRVINTILNLIK